MSVNKTITNIIGSGLGGMAIAIRLAKQGHKITEAQDNNNFRTRIYKSYTQGRMNDWKAVLNDMEKLYKKSKNSQLLHELLENQYGYIGFCIKEDRKKEGSYYLEKARDNLEILMSERPDNAEYLAFEGAFLGYEMGIHKYKAMVLGPKAKDKIESEPDLLENNWIYVNTLVVLAQAYEKMGNNTYACAIYEKIMSYDPSIKWVRNDLYSGCDGNNGS